MNPVVELVSIGNELLSGRTLNSHAQTLGRLLAPTGIRLVRDTTVPDEPEAVQSAVRSALDRVDVVLVSGGLGPTADDITRETLAKLLVRGVVESPAAVADLEAKYLERGRTVTPVARRQARVLEGAGVLLNPVGMAPGEQLDLPEGKTLFILPGPPNEFSAVLEAHIVPHLRSRFGEQPLRPERVFTTRGIGESDIVTLFEAHDFPPLELAACYYPGGGRVEIRLSCAPEHRAVLEQAARNLCRLLEPYLQQE